jgi:hypothetical protein
VINHINLWDADGNEIRDEYPQMDPHDILRNPENAIFNLNMIVGGLLVDSKKSAQRFRHRCSPS